MQSHNHESSIIRFRFILSFVKSLTLTLCVNSKSVSVADLSVLVIADKMAPVKSTNPFIRMISFIKCKIAVGANYSSLTKTDCLVQPRRPKIENRSVFSILSSPSVAGASSGVVPEKGYSGERTIFCSSSTSCLGRK